MTKEKTQKELHWGECKHCWMPFLGLRSDKQYCSASCKQLAYQERKKRASINIIVIEVKKKPGFRAKFIKLLQKLASIPF